MDPHHLRQMMHMMRALSAIGARGGGDPFARHGGHGWRGRARRGDVRAAILAVLSEKPMNGYQIMQALEEKSRGIWRPSPGAVYPALQQLEDEGLIRAETSDGGSGRVFHLTDDGKKRVEKQQARSPWEAFVGDDDIDDGMSVAKLVPEIVPAIIQIAQSGSPAQVAEAKKVLKQTKRALYRILAEDGDDDE